MRYIILLSTLAWLGVMQCDAKDEALPLCFDYSKRVVSPLHPKINGAQESHKLANGAHWSAVRGRTEKPIQQVMQFILDHNNTKSSSVDEVTTQILSDSKYFARHLVHFVVKPFPLVRIIWNEDWVYAIVEGTPAAPRVVVASYQKTEGTSYIKQLCGSIVLEKISDQVTDVYFVEQTLAARTDEKDTVEGLQNTLKSLNRKKTTP